MFSVGTSSSASERNFSAFAHLWSNRANSLAFNTVDKLMFVYWNQRALQKLRDGTGRGVCVPHGWLKAQIEQRTAGL